MPKSGYKKVKWLFGKEIEIPEEWEVKKLKEISKLQGGYAFKSEDYQEEGILLLKIANVSHGKFKWDEKSFVPKKYWNEHSEFQIKNGDIILAMTRPIISGGLKIAIFNESKNILLNQRVGKFILQNVNSYFFFCMINQKSTIDQITTKLGESGQPNISSDEIGEIKICHNSNIHEQQKIATILSNVDELISSYDKTIQTTKKLKKGLMQTLLTRGIGHKKFKKVKWLFGKEIEIPEEWELKNVGNVADKLLSGGTPSTNIPQYWNGEIPWTKGAVLTKSDTISGERFITKEGLKNSSTSIIPKDNLLVVSRVSIGNVSINKIDIAINQDITAIILNSSLCLTRFLYWNLLYSIKDLVSIGQGTTIQGFNRKDLSNHKVLLPPLSEQQKIASILSSVDEKISKLESKKKSAESLKKGLMQKLLTGQIRVTV